MSSEVEFCRNWCVRVTEDQEAAVRAAAAAGLFFGVGRPRGEIDFCPLVNDSEGRSYAVLPNGRTRLASPDGAMQFWEPP
jgi:hypothetical protein